MKKTVVIGASPEASRYSNLASRMLDNAGFEFVPVGIKNGEILGKPILDLREKPAIDNVHTVTMYLNPTNQKDWYSYILSLEPKRIIFNPGTENPEFFNVLKENNINFEIACTLVLLSTNQY